LYRRRAGPNDKLHLATRRFGASASAWPSLGAEQTADLAAIRRTLALRTAPARTPRASLLLAADARLAVAHARHLSPDYTHLIVAQALLPHLWLSDTLQGRSFEVLMDRLPMAALHCVLDEALVRHSESTTLGDFRAPDLIVTAEREALGAAAGLITAHRAVAALFPTDRVELLDWEPAPCLTAQRGGRTFLFAGPTLARKGAHAMREAMKDLDIDLLLERSAEEEAGFWEGLSVRQLSPDEKPADLAAVVLPALIEQRPYTLLRALAAGLPVIATPACGLPPQPGLTLVPPDDAQSLREALLALMAD